MNIDQETLRLFMGHGGIALREHWTLQGIIRDALARVEGDWKKIPIRRGRAGGVVKITGENLSQLAGAIEAAIQERLVEQR